MYTKRRVNTVAEIRRQGDLLAVVGRVIVVTVGVVMFYLLALLVAV